MKILIVEDELRATKRLVRLTREILENKVTTIETSTRLSNARKIIEKSKIDLLLLDLNLNGKDGFDALKSVMAERFPTIIVSAYHQRAIEAFEYGVLDFVPKPIDKARLRKAFKRLDGIYELQRIHPRYLAVKSAGKVDFIQLEKVLHIKGAGDYSEIHLINGKSQLYEKTLDSLERMLVKDFVRIHRSHIVRESEIAALHSAQGTRYIVELKNGLELPAGRTRIEEIKSRMDAQ